jgi:hypothetical protein
MARLPKYCRIINRYRDQIDAFMKTSYGNRKYKRIGNRLLKSLAITLMTGKAPVEKLPDRILTSILRDAEQQIAGDEFSLPKAWYELRTYETSQKAAAGRWHVHPLEIKHLEKMWMDLRYTRQEYRRIIEQTRPSWPFAVDERHEEIVVWLDDKAIEDIVLVALEAYAVPRRGLKFTETYGICFGSTKTTEEKRQAHGKHLTRYIHVSSVHIQLRAEGYSNKVTYDLRSLEAQMAVAQHLFPQLDIVGDFHTHPYKTAEELKRLKGWRYSRADEGCIPDWADPLRKMGYHPRASLVVAIATGSRRISRPVRLKHNVVRFSIDRYHLYVASFRIIGTKYSDKNITLYPISLSGK